MMMPVEFTQMGSSFVCRFGLVHKFLWDRYRAVRQDLYVQGINVGLYMASCVLRFGIVWSLVGLSVLSIYVCMYVFVLTLVVLDRSTGVALLFVHTTDQQMCSFWSPRMDLRLPCMKKSSDSISCVNTSFAMRISLVGCVKGCYYCWWLDSFDHVKYVYFNLSRLP